ncbi:penicillin-binding transpeptidase domain-containing protein [Bacteroides uniformis]|uniref:penicillin-binding transpeptidase domain-containing protein n=1 Tax=Bacteroides uniformis TaxID=820 RepID=UPI00232CBC38|nr:penicillin-binding transpeptidase domain-containing protein [Bacteroides uniformis]MDC1730529.1 penicillin-binding transpeptidase domain-containing protein [Bacteroides uniformis]MDC1735039.1 penicillin-binding transpeptidase domain-containing protein [Bacteroides uniformis]MDC1742335.1 penicillin-binding transpeptidase domain-containing protein [Bacteroides uniformis]MDC1745897.1 penicillin-binding transpeptidase domain-containing protein [Bacteroides uniformis]MDC1966296.1 penicillin-bind
MKLIIILFIAVSISSCKLKESSLTNTETIDSTLQVKATSVLENKLTELNALSGQTIIMEVQTGHIKAMVGLERKDSADYQPCENFSQTYESALIQPISILTALETGKIKLTDTIDVGDGIYICKGDTIKDHNWHRGGYGKITIKQGLASSSEIAVYKAMEMAFNGYTQAYYDQLKDMNMSNLDTPLQMLTAYNSIANNKNNQANIDSLKQALEYVVTDGLGQPAKSDKVQVAGKTGTVQLEDGSYIVEFCGYFPAHVPKYSIIVSIHKEELPASGGLMAGDVFRQIVDYMNE